MVPRLQPTLHPRRPRRPVPSLRRTRRDIRPARHPHHPQHPLTCNTTRVGTLDEQHWGFSISGIIPPQGDSEGPNLHQLHSTAITWTLLHSPSSSVRGTHTSPASVVRTITVRR